jgi:hypothetical protein
MVGCTEPATATLNTVTLQVDKGAKEKLKILVDTGAQLSLFEYDSIKEGSVYDPKRVVNIRGMSSCTERTLGDIELSLSTENYETTHLFQVVDDGIIIPYDGILGQHFSRVRMLKLILRKEKLLWVT